MAIRTYPLANKALGGRLPARLRKARKDGLSNQQIADALAVDGIAVSRETIRTWCRELGLDEKAAAS